MALKQQPNCWRSLVGGCNATRPPRTPSGCAADPRLAPAARALGRCVDCGLPQRHEACHRLAHEALERRGLGGNLSAVASMPTRAAAEAAEYERALSELHRSGRCRWAPCAAEPPPPPSASLGATAVAEPLTRLLLGLAAFVPRAARAAQQAEAVAKASPELLHEWAALVQQRLEEGWRRAAACRGGGCGGGGSGGAGGPREAFPGGYIVLRGGGEQMHKAKFLVADA